jgi:hypothetical protein
MFLTEKDKWLITRGSNDSQPFASNGDKWVAFDDLNAVKHRVSDFFPTTELSLKQKFSWTWF